MNKRSLFRIIDISLVSAVLLGVFGFIGISVLNSKNEHDAYEKETLDALRDESGHIPSVIKAVAPTETSVGYTAGKKCLECGAVYEGCEEIPMLTEASYTRKTESYPGGVKVTWTLKDELVPTYGNKLTYDIEYGRGFVSVNGTNYVPYDFNKAFPGIEMSYDEDTSTIIWNVKEEGGYTIENTYFKVPTENDNLLIKGEPLTIIARTDQDTLNVDSKTGNIAIQNELNIWTANKTNISGNSSALVANTITIEDGACLRAHNMKYAFYAETEITVLGELDASGATGAVYSSGMTSRPINIGENRSVYVKESKKTVTDNAIKYGDAGKHLVVCNSSIANIDTFLTFKLSGDIVQPTDSATGSAKLTCLGCGTTTKNIVLPKLGGSEYDETATPIKIDGAATTISAYKYNVPNTHVDPIVFDKRDALDQYINAGGYYYSPTGWNKLFPNAKGTLSSNVFTINLTGDQSIGTSTTTSREFDGILDLTCYDKVVVKGSKKLSFAFTSATKGLLVNELEIQSGATVSIVGKAKETGLTVKKALTVSGTLDISNYVTALDIKNDSASVTANVNVASGGTMKLSASSNGFYNSTPVNFVNEGTLNIEKAKIGMNIAETNSLKFSGTSETIINSSTNCIRGQYDDYLGDRLGNDTRKNPKIRICDSAKFNATSTGGAGIMLYLQFIVENENGSKCNAEVNVTCSGSGAAIYGLRTGEDSNSGSDYTKIFVVNSSKEMNILGTTTSTTKGQAGLYFREKNVKIQIKTPLHIGNFAHAIRQNKIQWSSGNIVYDNSNPMITFDNYNASEPNFYDMEAFASGYKLQDVIYKFKNSSGSVIDLSAN